MFVYKIITGEITSSDSKEWMTLLRQEPCYDTTKPDGRYSWVLSDLEDTPENRTFLSLKHEFISFMSIQEFITYIEDSTTSSTEKERFRGFVQMAIDYYKNQLTA